jgi:hypothetical protein
LPQGLLEWNNSKKDYTSIGSGLQPCVEARQTGREERLCRRHHHGVPGEVAVSR